MFVAAIGGELAFVATATLGRAWAIPACTAARSAATKKLDASVRASAEGDQETRRDAIAADFIRCFAERAPREPRFADAVKQARSLYERMQAK